MRPCRTPEEIRAANRAAIHRVPEGIRLVALPPPEPKETAMETHVSPSNMIASKRWSLAWPLVVATLVGAVLFGLLMLIPGCKTIGTPVLQRVERTVDCLKDRLPEQAVAYLDVVTSCLAGGDYLACLAPLAEKAGRDVVACSVAQAGSEARARASRVSPGSLPNAERIATHADAYLEADGARVSLP